MRPASVAPPPRCGPGSRVRVRFPPRLKLRTVTGDSARREDELRRLERPTQGLADCDQVVSPAPCRLTCADATGNDDCEHGDQRALSQHFDVPRQCLFHSRLHETFGSGWRREVVVRVERPYAAMSSASSVRSPVAGRDRGIHRGVRGCRVPEPERVANSCAAMSLM